VIRHAPLREVIGADAFGPIPGADLAAPIRGTRLINGIALLFIKPGAQHLHRLGAVLVLAFFFLHRDHNAAWHMGDAHRAIRLVHMLPTGTRGAIGINAQILVFDLHINFLCFRQHGNRHRGGMDAPLGFRGWHALDAMNAAFVFQPREHAGGFPEWHSVHPPHRGAAA